MRSWRPATIEDVKVIVTEDLSSCDAEQAAAFARYKVEPFIAPILRYGQSETVVVVARKGDQVIYYEDVEEGFNVTAITPDGRIVEHWCNQDNLGQALNAGIKARRQLTVGKLAAASDCRFSE